MTKSWARFGLAPTLTYNDAVKKSGLARWIAGGIVGIIAVLGLVAAGYALWFADRSLPGVSVAGMSVTGQTHDQLVDGITARADAVTISADFLGTVHEFSLDDLGATVDAETTAAKALESNTSMQARFQALGTDTPITPTVSFDDDKVREVAEAMATQAGSLAKEASVSIAEDGITFLWHEGGQGKGVDVEALSTMLRTAATTLTSKTEVLTPIEITPKLTSEMARIYAEAGNSIVATDVTIETSGDTVGASPADKFSWVKIPDVNAGETHVSVDAAKIAEWVNAVGANSNVAPVDGVNNVNSRGDVISVYYYGTKGMTVNNTAAVAEALTASISTSTPYAGAFTYDITEPNYTTRLVADGAERLVYHAAPGEKWVDINLSGNYATAYEGSTPVRGPMWIVPGAPGMNTPTGTFAVYLKYQTQTMRGTNADGSRYVSPNVPWVTYFTGSIAMHGAPWQPSFGWSGPGGSHGCVNMPVGDAQFIYNWTNYGTKVISHY